MVRLRGSVESTHAGAASAVAATAPELAAGLCVGAGMLEGAGTAAEAFLALFFECFALMVAADGENFWGGCKHREAVCFPKSHPAGKGAIID